MLPSEKELEELDWACGLNHNPFKLHCRTPIGFYRDREHQDPGDPETIRQRIKDAAARGITRFIG